MKKTVLIMISFLLIFTLAACSSQNTENANGNSNPSNTPPSGSENNGAEKPYSENPNETSDEKILVVYFSATENTRKAAEYIASATGGDLFELVPVTPYSGDDLNWNDKNSRVVYEHDNPNERNVALTTAISEGFDEYDTVFLGYPKLYPANRACI